MRFKKKPIAEAEAELRESMRDIYRRCSDGVSRPHVMVMNGAVLNQLLETDTYDPHAAYNVTSDAITKIDDIQ